VPDTHPHPYEHQRRLAPPPERPAPPNLRYLAYIGLALTAVLVALAAPYVIGYLVQVVTH